MACKYRDDCPSRSPWCDGPKQDYERCIPFLITAYERAENERDRYEDKLKRIKEIFKI